MSLDTYYRYDLSFLTPVDRLPPELLNEIFIYCAEALGDELIALTLGSICRYWRDIVNESPRVWQHVFLNESRKIQALHQQGRLWLARSASLPLHVHVELLSGDMLLPLLSPILPHIHRWRTCEITRGVLTEYADFSALAADTQRSRLNRLQVVVRGSSGIEDLLLPDDDVSGLPTFQSSMSSSPLHGDDISMRVLLSTLPMLHQMSPLHISQLTISESLHICTDAPRMLGFLSALPALESFTFYGNPHESNSNEDPTGAPIACLTRLHSLVLRSTRVVRTILSHIHAPSLTELYLEHTNVDTEMRYDPYAAIVEDGDSDDEANDFSQSPWSDRATGMGLRTLIRRSNPPLEVIEMDYADMRTKDFLWCFDRLDRLREFRIVASDMSNTVINMLAPIEPPDHLYHGEDGLDMATIGRSLRVRLPKLSVLGLWNCQRLSGDAIVTTLLSRVAHTDAIANKDTCTLTDVFIVGCPAFHVHHAMDLSPVLGNRLRIS